MTNKSCCNRWGPLAETKSARCGLGASGLFLFLLATVPAARCGDAPQWMHAVANATLPEHDEKTNAVLLYSEDVLSVQSNGKIKKGRGGDSKFCGRMAGKSGTIGGDLDA